MSDEKSGPHDRLEGERQEAQDEASASAQDSISGHVEMCSHTAHEEARDSERPSPSPLLPTHGKARDSEKSSPGPLPPTHEEARSSEKSSHSSQPPAHEQEQHASVKGRPIGKRKARKVRGKRDEETEQMKQERRRLENERRLEGQRRENELKIEARRKVGEAAVAARTQSEGEKRSTNGGELPQRFSGSEEREDAKGGCPTLAIKMDDDQKVHNDGDAENVGASEPRVLEHDTGATCLAITEDKHSESHLIMMAHSASVMSLAPHSPPITPRDPFDTASSHSGLGYCYYDKDDVTCQCRQYWCQCGLVREYLREDSQTGMEANYLFDPPLLLWPSPKPLESVQTRQDATDVLFRPSLERPGDSPDTPAVLTVIIPRVKTGYYIRNNGVSTPRNMTHDIQQGRRATRRGGYRGFRSRG